MYLWYVVSVCMCVGKECVYVCCVYDMYGRMYGMHLCNLICMYVWNVCTNLCLYVMYVCMYAMLCMYGMFVSMYVCMLCMK